MKRNEGRDGSHRKWLFTILRHHVTFMPQSTESLLARRKIEIICSNAVVSADCRLDQTVQLK